MPDLTSIDGAEGPATATPLPATAELGRALRVHRLACGLSLRGMARRIGMSAHSGLVDYERGRRVLPEDLALACERALELPAGYLVSLRRRALAELAEQKLGQQEAASLSSRQSGSPVQKTNSRAADGGVAPSQTGWTEDLAAIAEGLRKIAGIMFFMGARIANAAMRWLIGRLVGRPTRASLRRSRPVSKRDGQ